jgi:methylmalonyl-CoA decarboxylase subunit alpha
MTWEEMTSEVRARHQAAASADALPSARERITRLLDAGSFTEAGVLAVSPVRGRDGRVTGGRYGGSVCGFGRIDGRLVAIASEGPLEEPCTALGPSEQPKSGWDGFAERLAREYRCPLVLLLDGLGGANSYSGRHDYPYLESGIRTEVLFDLLDRSPVVVGVLGPVAGIAASRVVASHFSVMAKDRGRVFAASAAQAARLDPDESLTRGGAVRQAGLAGNVDNVGADEQDVLAQLRRFLSYLPSNVWEAPPAGPAQDAAGRLGDEILALIGDNPRAPFDPKKVIERIVDDQSFFELAGSYGRSLMAGLARLNGVGVGVLASNSRHLAGAMDAASSEKQARLVELCDTFHLPIIYFADVPGFMIGLPAEASGLMRRGVRALIALHRATVPVFTVLMRRTYGLAGQATGSPNRLSVKLAWPTGEWGDMPIAGGVDALYRKEIEAAADPEALRREIEQRLLDEASIWRTAEAFGVEDIIDPRDTRRVLGEWVRAAVEHRAPGPKQGPQYRP